MEKLSVFKCAKCGNIVEVMHVGGGTLSCCGEPMKLLKENENGKHHNKFTDNQTDTRVMRGV